MNLKAIFAVMNTAVYSPLHGFIRNQHSWLVSSVGRALHRYRRGHGFKSRTGLNLFKSNKPKKVNTQKFQAHFFFLLFSFFFSDLMSGLCVQEVFT